MSEPTHIEINAATLKCECGTETLLMEACFDMRGTLSSPLCGHPRQQCPGCKRWWWLPATVDCEATDGD